MTGVTADSTDDIGCEIALFWTVKFAMTDLTTVLACLVLIVTKSTIKCCKLTELVAFEFVLAFGDRCSLQMISKVSTVAV